MKFLKNLKKKIKNLFSKGKSLYESLDDSFKLLIPVAIKVVEGLKSVTTDSKIDDMLVAALQAAFGTTKATGVMATIIAYIEVNCPKWILMLEIAQEVTSVDTVDEKALSIMKLVNEKSDSNSYKELAAIVYESLSDSKLSAKEIAYIVDYFYNNIYKK